MAVFPTHFEIDSVYTVFLRLGGSLTGRNLLISQTRIFFVFTSSTIIVHIILYIRDQAIAFG